MLSKVFIYITLCLSAVAGTMAAEDRASKCSKSMSCVMRKRECKLTKKHLGINPQINRRSTDSESSDPYYYEAYCYRKKRSSTKNDFICDGYKDLKTCVQANCESMDQCIKKYDSGDYYYCDASCN